MLFFLTTQNLLKTINSLVSVVHPVMPIVKATRWIAKDAQKKTSGLTFHGVPVQPFYWWCRPHGPKHRQLQNGSPIKKVVVACFEFTVDASLHNAWQLYKKGDNNFLLTIWDFPDA